MTDRANILEGVRVVEAASMVMVPSVGAILAEYGAEVIKVEPLIGDLNRRGHHIPGMPLHSYEYCFLPDNRNKRSIALDLKSARGLEILHQLVARADVILTNYRESALEKLQINYEHLRVHNPRLIYAHGTGFGDQGEEAGRAGFDAVSYWSRSGMEASLFPLEGWLGSLGYGTGDHPSGMSLFGAVMLALFRRQNTGEGGRVTTSLLANGAWSNAVMVQARLCGAEFLPRLPREQARNFTGVYYKSRDGRIFKMVLVDVEQGWPRVCRALGRADLIENPDYATTTARGERMSELIALFDEIFAQQDIDHWQRELNAADVPYSLVATYDDVAADPQMTANEVFVDVEDSHHGTFRTVTSPLRIDGQPKQAATAAPHLGADGRDILAELGYPPDRIDDFCDRGILGN